MKPLTTCPRCGVERDAHLLIESPHTSRRVCKRCLDHEERAAKARNGSPRRPVMFRIEGEVVTLPEIHARIGAEVTSERLRSWALTGALTWERIRRNVAGRQRRCSG